MVNLAQTQFFEQFQVKKYFLESGLKWNHLEDIFQDYSGRLEEFENHTMELRDYLLQCFASAGVKVHFISLRAKAPYHLLEKIIRKVGKDHETKYADIDKDNYTEIIHDLICARVLLLYKEEWKEIFQTISKAFPTDKGSDVYMAERPVAYAKYGDRDIYGALIHKEHTNKGYRSQHYVVSFRGYYCELQVRTLAEEVYGEFDHFVKYPYRENNRFLRRYTNSLSDLLDAVDELISTCVQMKAAGWEKNYALFEEDDEYTDWQHLSQLRILAGSCGHSDAEDDPESLRTDGCECEISCGRNRKKT